MFKKKKKEKEFHSYSFRFIRLCIMYYTVSTYKIVIRVYNSVILKRLQCFYNRKIFAFLKL